MSAQPDMTTQSIVRPGSRAEAVRNRLAEMTPGSAAINGRGREVLAMEVVPTVDMPHPIYIADADGPHMTDVDGNRFIDLTMGFGPHVLGHRPVAVTAAVHAQADRGWHFGIHNPIQQELAALLVDAAPALDSAVFCNSGTEATMYAMRVARAFTGKDRVALFDGSYHGAHDYALVKADAESPRNRPTGKILGGGVPDAINTDTMMVLPYRDATAFDLIRAYSSELALVIVEPVQSSNPRLDQGDFLRELIAVCREADVLVLLDEVITGFRLAYGGGQAHFDLMPDLATYGKALGGGFPIGAVGGRRDIMALFSDRGGEKSIFSGGTFSGNPMTMAAGRAAVGHMRDKADEIYPYLMTEGERFSREINDFCRDHEIAAQVLSAGSMFYMRFQAAPINSWRDIDLKANPVAEREFYLHLLAQGVIVPGIHLAFFSYAHRPDHVDAVIAAFKEAFLEVRADGLL